MNLVSQIEQTIEADKLIAPGDAVVVAVSGGPDSVALLHVLFLLAPKWDLRLVAAHVNHQFRGAESDAEAEFVASFASKLGLPCEVGVIDVPAYIEHTALNAQAAAREKRYDFLHAVAEQHGATRIALAHHADDQAETVMMRILRGTGPSGLAGMPMHRVEKKVELIRPLLRIYKSEVVQHCLEHGLSFCLDSSNESRKYFRNQVRLDVLPMLRKYNEQLPESLNRLAELMRAEDDYMDGEAVRAFEAIVTPSARSCRLSRADFARLHIALQRRLIKLILKYLASGLERPDFARMEAVRHAIVQKQPANIKLDIYEQLSFVREYDDVRFQRPAALTSSFSYTLDVAAAAELQVPEAGMKFLISVQEAGEDRIPSFRSDSSSTSSEAIFDLDALAFPLTVRNRAAGDRIEPLGLNGSKKVKDMFIDAKIPPSLRETTPLLVDAAGRILWIPGIRRSRHALAHSGTKRLLRIQADSYPSV